MSPEMITIVGISAVAMLIFLIFALRSLPKRVKMTHYVKKWREIQALCANKDDWPHAIVHADMLLDEVLKKRKISGKTMGERMVSAQTKFSANDALWSAHKLANTIRQEGATKISEATVKDSLVAFRQALRDLRAL